MIIRQNAVCAHTHSAKHFPSSLPRVTKPGYYVHIYTTRATDTQLHHIYRGDNWQGRNDNPRLSRLLNTRKMHDQDEHTLNRAILGQPDKNIDSRALYMCIHAHIRHERPGDNRETICWRHVVFQWMGLAPNLPLVGGRAVLCETGLPVKTQVASQDAWNDQGHLIIVTRTYEGSAVNSTACLQVYQCFDNRKFRLRKELCRKSVWNL